MHNAPTEKIFFMIITFPYSLVQLWNNKPSFVETKMFHAGEIFELYDTGYEIQYCTKLQKRIAPLFSRLLWLMKLCTFSCRHQLPFCLKRIAIDFPISTPIEMDPLFVEQSWNFVEPLAVPWATIIMVRINRRSSARLVPPNQWNTKTVPIGAISSTWIFPGVSCVPQFRCHELGQKAPILLLQRTST